MRFDPYGPGDAADWLALLNLTRAVPLSATDFVAREALHPPGEIIIRAVGRLGEATVAIGQLAIALYAPADHLALLIVSAPARRGAGLGTAMLVHLEGAAVDRGYAGLAATMPETATESITWMERRGFARHALRFDSLLDLGSLPPDMAADAALPPGILLHDMTAASNVDWREIADLFATLLADVPDMRGLPHWDAARCDAVLRRSPGARADWVVIARRDGRPVGLTIGHAMGAEIYSFFTGVVPSLRGSGLAHALKRRLIAAAQADGIALMRTTNLETNTPALRLNAALGFLRVPGSVELRKRIDVQP